MTSLSAIPGYQELLQQAQASNAKSQQLLAQSKAARESGNTQLADQLQNEAVQLTIENQSIVDQLTNLREQYANSELASPTVTTGQSQSTPQTNDDAPGQAPTSGGVGAGKSTDAFSSKNSDDNPLPSNSSNQLVINASTASLNQFVNPQPNQLDQYASYTYSIGWYVLSPEQYNQAIRTQKPNVTGWQLLMQSGGAPIRGRSPAFPVDYYMDDLEIESLIPFGGTNMANSATNIRFKVTEPNGITLIQNLFNAVNTVYKNAQQVQTNTTSATPNYLQAQYCLVIEFYGYDSQGNLVAPAKGSITGSSQKAVIAKYYPFRIVDIKFQIANRAIEYNVTGKPIPYSYNSSTDRGTIPFPFTMTGQTVDQLLNGSAISNTTVADAGRQDQPEPPVNQAASATVIVEQSRAVVDANGNFTGETTSPFNVVAP